MLLQCFCRLYGSAHEDLVPPERSSNDVTSRYQLATDIETHFISRIGMGNGRIVTTQLNTVTVYNIDVGREDCSIAITGRTFHHRRQPLYSSHMRS